MGQPISVRIASANPVNGITLLVQGGLGGAAAKAIAFRGYKVATLTAVYRKLDYYINPNRWGQPRVYVQIGKQKSLTITCSDLQETDFFYCNKATLGGITVYTFADPHDYQSAMQLAGSLQP